MESRPYSHARTFRTYATVSTICLFLSVLAGAFVHLSPRTRLLPPYIFFFSFAAFSVMLFHAILSRSPERLPELDLREQRGMLVAAVGASCLCVISELTAVGWPKVLAGVALGSTVLQHGYRIWRGFTLRQIWQQVALRFFVTDTFFLLVAAVGLTALGWKEAWPGFPFIPGFLRPATVFLGASFPLTLTFTGFLYLHAEANGGLSPREQRIFDWWYYLLVGGVLFFLPVILLDSRALMQVSALVLLVGVFVVNLVYVRRLARNPGSLSLLFATVGLMGLLAASAAGNALIASHTPTIPAGKNPILLSHVHLAQLGWVCVSFWAVLYTLWPMMLQLDAGRSSTAAEPLIWLPLGTCYPPAARRLAYLQLVLATGALVGLVASHLLPSPPLMAVSGLVYAAATLIPLVILRLLERDAPAV